MLKKTWLYLYFIITCGLLFAGYLFEEAYGRRLWALLCLALIYVAVLMVSVLGVLNVKAKEGVRSGISLASPVSVLMVLLLLAIEFYSKYAVNYFFHTLYILLIFYCIVHIPSRVAIGVSIFVTLLSFVKFIELILVQTTFANIALLVFFGSVQILVVVIGIFLRVYREETEKTQALYEELLASHEQLKAYAQEIRELSQMEARNRIARDLHDTLGHELTGLIMQMEMAGSHFEQSQEAEGMAMLMASKASARESLVKVREIVETLKHIPEAGGEKGSPRQLAEDFAKRTGCRIGFVQRGDKHLDDARELVLYRLVQESLTNAVRHGRARAIDVTLIYGSDEVSFEISNDGLVTSEPVEGHGIQGMRERLAEFGGSLAVEGAPIFRVWGVLPYEDRKKPLAAEGAEGAEKKQRKGRIL